MIKRTRYKQEHVIFILTNALEMRLNDIFTNPVRGLVKRDLHGHKIYAGEFTISVIRESGAIKRLEM